jgi:hypothetical protein
LVQSALAVQVWQLTPLIPQAVASEAVLQAAGLEVESQQPLAQLLALQLPLLVPQLPDEQLFPPLHGAQLVPFGPHNEVV